MFTHAHVSMITYRVDVYRSRPIGAAHPYSPGMPGPEGPAHGLAGHGDGYQCGFDGGVLVAPITTEDSGAPT